MKKTGAILKEARESKGLSLHEIGLSLKINSKILKAIEEGDEQQLPAKTFLRGFVQSYAAYLHLNVSDVLQSFYEEMGSTIPKPYHPPTPASATVRETTPPAEVKTSATEAETPVTKTSVAAEPIKPNKPTETQAFRELDSSKFLNDQRKSNSKMRAIGVTLLVVLTGGIIFTKKMVDKYSKEAEVPSEQIAQTIEGVTPLDNEVPLISEPDSADSGDDTNTSDAPMSRADQTPATPATKPASTSAITSAPVTPAPTPPAPTPAAATPTPTNPPPPPAANTPSPTNTQAAPDKPTPPLEKPQTAESVKNLVLIVEALDTVEIEYSSPQGTPAKIKLGPEQVHTFKSKSGLKLRISNGGAVNLIVNGRDLGVPGDLGKPLSLSY